MTPQDRLLIETIESALTPVEGQLLVRIDGRKCRKKRGLMREFGAAIGFPSPVRNWDAFADWMELDLQAQQYDACRIIVTDADDLLASASDELPAAMRCLERSCREAELPVTIELVCRAADGMQRLREALDEARRRWV